MYEAVSRGYDCYESKLLGSIGMVVSTLGVEGIFLKKEHFEMYLQENPEIKANAVLCQTIKKQLEAYFLGERIEFNVPIHIKGTPFRRQVWHALREIPYGEVRSYQEVAQAINKPKACRAVGGANRANPIPIIIPCHRVIGANGRLVGFMGNETGLQERLLTHEKEVLAKRR